MLFLVSDRRAVVDVIDDARDFGTPAALYHLAANDVWAAPNTFISVTQMCRDIAELATTQDATRQDLDRRLKDLEP